MESPAQDKKEGSSVTMADQVVYKRGTVERYSWRNELEDNSKDVFYHLWKEGFETITLRLVESKDPPENTVNCVGWRKDKYKEKHKGPHVVIVDGTKNSSSCIAVIDHQNPKRVFFGQQVSTYYPLFYLVGGICYFDEDGNMDGNITPFTCKVFRHDHRNGTPRWNNLFLCGNTFSYVWEHRDILELEVEGYFLQDDQPKGRYVKLKSWHDKVKKPNYKARETNILESRWLCTLFEEVNQYFCIDLKSIRQGNPDQENSTIYDSVAFPSSMDPIKAIQSLADVPTVFHQAYTFTQKLEVVAPRKDLVLSRLQEVDYNSRAMQPDPSAATMTGQVVYKKDVVQDHTWTSDLTNKSNDVFYQLWENKFKTIKLRLVESEDPPENTVNCAFMGWGNDKYKKNHKGPHVVIVDGTKNSCTYVAVVDHQNPKRVFFGEVVSIDCTSHEVVGGLCYFDDDGNMDGNITPFTAGLFQSGGRGPEWDSLYLCGRTFIYAYAGQGYEVCIMGYSLQDDQLKGHYRHLIRDAGHGSNGMGVEFHLFENRWLCTSHVKSDQCYCIDLLSIRQGQEDPSHPCPTIYDTLAFPSSMEASQVITSLTDVPHYGIVERDGYPAMCIKCGKATVSGRLFIAAGKFSTIEGGLGLAACQDCLIRYSHSNKVWKCWNIVCRSGDLDECFATVNGPNYICDKEHVSGEKIDFCIKVQEDKKRKHQEVQTEIVAYAKRKKGSNGDNDEELFSS